MIGIEPDLRQDGVVGVEEGIGGDAVALGKDGEEGFGVGDDVVEDGNIWNRWLGWIDSRGMWILYLHWCNKAPTCEQLYLCSGWGTSAGAFRQHELSAYLYFPSNEQ